MQNEPQRQADQAALDIYLHMRGEGEAHERAIQRAIFAWLSRCDWVDGREARIRVTQLLLVSRAMAPHDFEDWVILALGNDLWNEGVPAAVHRLSVHCRALEIGAAESGSSVEDYEAVGADVLRDYLRTELPRKVSRLRQLAFELMTHERPSAVESR
jgi:hypothetical protein